MRVRVAVTVDVDPETWDLIYGTGTNPAAVREDVKRYVQETIIEQLIQVGVSSE